MNKSDETSSSKKTATDLNNNVETGKSSEVEQLASDLDKNLNIKEKKDAKPESTKEVTKEKEGTDAAKAKETKKEVAEPAAKKVETVPDDQNDEEDEDEEEEDDIEEGVDEHGDEGDDEDGGISETDEQLVAGGGGLGVGPGGSSDPGKMFIGGLSGQTTPENLKKYFEEFGTVIECMIMKDAITRRSR